MWPNPQVDLATFTEEILNGKLHFLCRVSKKKKKNYDQLTLKFLISVLVAFAVSYTEPVEEIWTKTPQNICYQTELHLVVEFSDREALDLENTDIRSLEWSNYTAVLLLPFPWSSNSSIASLCYIMAFTS